ncbi:MAG: NAD(P)H-binding protein [Myxococcota bacterium]
MSADNVTVIGATGSLAVPVIHRWASRGVAVKALVRDVDKARGLLPGETELIRADLRDVDSLRRGLAGTRHLYLNLSTNTLDPNRTFYPEHQGVENVLQAVRGGTVEQILQLSGLGSHPANADRMPFFPNVVRQRGQTRIRESGIPFTFFHATWFLDAFPRFVRNGSVTLLGRFDSPFYFANSTDLADQVHRAIGNPAAAGRDFAIQGAEALPVDEAIARFVAVVSPGMPVRRLPLWLASALGLVVPQLRYAVAMTRFLQGFSAELLAEETWEVLGRPTSTLEDFFRAGGPIAPAAVIPAAVAE